jgi:hypothetical protein
MKMWLSTTTLILSFLLTNQIRVQTSTVSNHTASNYRHSIGSSLFLLGNFAPGNPPCFFQLNYGNRLLVLI